MADVDEKRVGKVDAATIIVSRVNGDKVVVRGSCFNGESVTVLAGQEFVARRAEGSVLFVVRPVAKAAPAFTVEDLRAALRAIPEDDGPYDPVDLLEPLAKQLGLRR